jgi:two-component system, chemotaxis family, response regulator Rcp1
MMNRPVEVLLVEDSPADARLAREALMEGPVPKRIHVVTDGAQALEFVRKRGQFANAPRPDLVLLDLNLPKRDGIEVLREIKSDPALRSITVIVLTTSQFPRDIATAYDLSANCYIVKPVDLDQFYHVMHGIEEFWMTLASLPTLGQSAVVYPSTRKSVVPEKPPSDKSGSASARIRSRLCWNRRRLQFAAPGVTAEGLERRLCHLLVKSKQHVAERRRRRSPLSVCLHNRSGSAI